MKYTGYGFNEMYSSLISNSILCRGCCSYCERGDRRFSVSLSLRLSRHRFCQTPPSIERRVILRGDGASRSCPGAEGAAEQGGTAHRLRPQARTQAAGMASVGAGVHLICRRAASRSSAVERRNLLTVCRWEFLTLISVCVTGWMDGWNSGCVNS